MTGKFNQLYSQCWQVIPLIKKWLCYVLNSLILSIAPMLHVIFSKNVISIILVKNLLSTILLSIFLTSH